MSAIVDKLAFPSRYTKESLDEKKTLLLHCCCGPCATAVVEYLLPYIRPTLYYYNPNTQPLEEYLKRKTELEKVAKYFNLDLIAEDYDDGEFLSLTKGYEREREGGARCKECFYLRLSQTAKKAKELKADAFTTTLTVSPHKNARLINAIGEELSEKNGVAWIYSDFKKQDGYKRSIDLSRELGLYRQSYCGCLFSKEGV